MIYVCGFLFSTDKKSVVLINKSRPTWMYGMHNGVGGKVEEHESINQAMEREFYEEAGVNIYTWEVFCNFQHGENTIYFMRAFNDLPVVTKTDEKVCRYPISKLQYLRPVPNLYWLIPLALDTQITQARIKQR